MIELKRFVERVVRPVPSPSVWQKVRMREELYAHLLEAYEYELTKNADEKESLHLAISRMGDPAELTADLSSTIPWIDRRSYQINKFFTRRPGEAFGRLSIRVTGVVAKMMAVTVIFGCAVRFDEILAWSPNGQIALRLMMSLLGSFVVGAFLLMHLAELLALYLAEPKSRLEIVLATSVIASISFGILLLLGISVHLISALSLDELPAAFWSCLPAALAGAVLCAGVCIANALESRASAPWLELEIDG